MRVLQRLHFQIVRLVGDVELCWEIRREWVIGHIRCLKNVQSIGVSVKCNGIIVRRNTEPYHFSMEEIHHPQYKSHCFLYKCGLTKRQIGGCPRNLYG